MRSFLRLEYLFHIVDHHSQLDSQWDSRVAISYLLNLLDLLSRSDIRSELIKELEKCTTTLDPLKNNPNVDYQRLNGILNNMNTHLSILRNSEFQFGKSLRDDELISSIRQRVSILGGTCNFDLPAFHHWLNQPSKFRHHDLQNWQQHFSVIQESLTIVLHMLRDNTTAVIENAESGFHQQSLESKSSCQLIRVLLPDDCDYFPKISGGRHRFTVRFMQQSSTSLKPIQTKNTVEFELHCCML